MTNKITSLNGVEELWLWQLRLQFDNATSFIKVKQDYDWHHYYFITVEEVKQSMTENIFQMREEVIILFVATQEKKRIKLYLHKILVSYLAT